MWIFVWVQYFLLPMGLCENFAVGVLFSGPVLIDPHLGVQWYKKIKRNVVSEVGLFGVYNVKKETKIFWLVRVACGIRPGWYRIESPNCGGSGFMEGNCFYQIEGIMYRTVLYENYVWGRYPKLCARVWCYLLMEVVWGTASMGSQVVGLVCADRRFGAKRGLRRYIISLWLYFCEITVKSSAREDY